VLVVCLWCACSVPVSPVVPLVVLAGILDITFSDHIFIVLTAYYQFKVLKYLKMSLNILEGLCSSATGNLYGSCAVPVYFVD
jgi:hypothetical protein